MAPARNDHQLPLDVWLAQPHQCTGWPRPLRREFRQDGQPKACGHERPHRFQLSALTRQPRLESRRTTRRQRAFPGASLEENKGLVRQRAQAHFSLAGDGMVGSRENHK